MWVGGVQDIGLVNIVTVTEENQRDHPLRFNGKCYQEFTPAFCPGPHQILFFNKPDKNQIVWPEGVRN